MELALSPLFKDVHSEVLKLFRSNLGDFAAAWTKDRIGCKLEQTRGPDNITVTIYDGDHETDTNVVVYVGLNSEIHEYNKSKKFVIASNEQIDWKKKLQKLVDEYRDYAHFKKGGHKYLQMKAVFVRNPRLKLQGNKGAQAFGYTNTTELILTLSRLMSQKIVWNLIINYNAVLQHLEIQVQPYYHGTLHDIFCYESRKELVDTLKQLMPGRYQFDDFRHRLILQLED